MTELDQLAEILPGSEAYLRAAFERAEDHWTLRTCDVVIGARPPGWSPAQWEYQPLALISAALPASALLSAFDPVGDHRLRLSQFEATVPPASESANWRHHPSLAPHDLAPLPWPTYEYLLHRKDRGAPGPQQGILVGEGCPSFPDDRSAIRAFFYGDFSTLGGHPGIPDELARIRAVQAEAWIHRILITPSRLDVRVRGDTFVGTRIEVNGSTLRASKLVGSSGRARLPLREGLPDDAWLYLSRGNEWLDYRALGPRLYGDLDLSALGVDIAIPDDPVSRVQALLAGGEGPNVEFKRSLPGPSPAEKRTVMKTVAAFANGGGGTIVFGIDPDETNARDLPDAGDPGARDRLGDLIRGIVVPTPHFEVQASEVDGRRLLILSVQAGADRPYGLMSRDGHPEFYVRRGASTYPATQAEVRASALSTVPKA